MVLETSYYMVDFLCVSHLRAISKRDTTIYYNPILLFLFFQYQFLYMKTDKYSIIFSKLILGSVLK